MIEYVQKKKNIILTILLILITITSMLIGVRKYELKNEKITKSIHESSVSIKDPDAEKQISEEELVDEFFNVNHLKFVFLAKTFQIDSNLFVALMKSQYKELNLLNQENLDYFLIEYLLNLENSDKSLFNKGMTPCKDSKEYIISLVKYFTNIYSNVNFNIAAAIANVESTYTSSYMLSVNNIFGGMSGSGLLRFKNIEYGVLKYIKMLNDGYFAKGLTTVEDIGKIYNPTITENGIKIAKPSWVTHVNGYLNAFGGYENVDINTLNSLKAIE